MLTGEAYKASAEMAGIVGPFPKYKENAENMLRVMNNHRKAAYDSNDYEGLSHDLIAIDQELCPEYLLEAAQALGMMLLNSGLKMAIECPSNRTCSNWNYRSSNGL